MSGLYTPERPVVVFSWDVHLLLPRVSSVPLRLLLLAVVCGQPQSAIFVYCVLLLSCFTNVRCSGSSCVCGRDGPARLRLLNRCAPPPREWTTDGCVVIICRDCDLWYS